MLVGCHGLVWSGNFDPKGFELALSQTKSVGFDLLEIPLLDPYSMDPDALSAIQKSYGLPVTASMAQGRDSDITSEDLSCVKAGEAKIMHALKVLQALGGKYLVGAMFGELRKYPEPVTKQARANGQAVMRNVVDAASEAGITMGIEVVNRYESNMINTARQALDYIDEVGKSALTVHLDTYHMNIEESDLFTPVLECGERLGYVHIGESHRGYLGSGSVNFTEFFHALNYIGYDGPVVFETFSRAVIHKDLTKMLAVWRDLWDDSTDLATAANSFMRAGLAGAANSRTGAAG